MGQTLTVFGRLRTPVSADVESFDATANEHDAFLMLCSITLYSYKLLLLWQERHRRRTRNRSF